MEVSAGWMIVGPVAYRRRDKSVDHGEIAMEVNRQGDNLVQPQDHTIRWVGAEIPCDRDGRRLDQLVHDSNTIEIEGRHSPCGMSRKKEGRSYTSYEEKAKTYARLIENGGGLRRSKIRRGSIRELGDARRSRRRGELKGLGKAMRKIEHQRIAIVGMGGTGGYILDMVSKSPVRGIDLFDGDIAENKNLDRWPGNIQEQELEGGANKAVLMARIYAESGAEIRGHETRITTENMEKIASADMVFICVDNGESRELIAGELIQRGRRFIDTGIGMDEQDGEIWGTCRVTMFDGDVSCGEEVRRRLPTQDRGENVYDRNIQIVELNAMNAAMAVTAWKQMSGTYRRGRRAAQINLHTASWHLIAKGEERVD